MALAAVGKGEEAQGHAVLIECGRGAANWAKRGHGWLQKVGMERKKPRRKRGRVLNESII
jgi:hypothetical protein